MSSDVQQKRFVSLLEEHKKIMFKVASSYSRGAADREDLVQEMVLQLWRAFDRYDERYPFSTWMYRITLNVAISHYRHTTRRRTTALVDRSVLELIAQAPDKSLQHDMAQDFHQLIQRLDELDRALVILYLDGNPYDTIAEILGISATNVGTKINRIKQRLWRDWKKS